MPDLRSYAAELEREIVPPALAELERVATRRARVRVTGALALSTAAAATVIAMVLGGPAADRASLPAVSPTHSSGSLSPDDIVRLGGGATETFASDDGVDATLTAHQVCPETPDAPAGVEECRVAYRVTGPGGAHQTYVLTRAGEALGPVAYLGRGEFIVYCTICGDDTAFYTVSAALPTPRVLPAEARPQRPGPGLTLVPCRGDTCIFDRTRRELAHLDLATLPYWVEKLMATPWIAMEPEAQRLATGHFYVPADLLLGGGYGRSPALIVEPGRSARELTQPTALVPASPGLTGWVGGSAIAGDCPCVVDPVKATISRIDLPPNVTWSHNTADGFWGLRAESASEGATTYTAVHTDAQGRQTTHDLAVADPDAFVQLAEDGTTRAMAYYEISRGGSPNLLHVSTDRGRTWRTLTVPTSVKDSIQNGLLLPTWETWPEAG